MITTRSPTLDKLQQERQLITYEISYCLYFFNSCTTDTAVNASNPVVGSSTNNT